MTNYEKAMFAVTLVLALAVFTLFGGTMAEAQETQYTKCVNNQGEVVIVTNFTCPRGYWPS